jgi:hypothetical protein
MGESLSGPASFNFKSSTRAGIRRRIHRKENNMADYFTNFSLIVPLPDEAAVQICAGSGGTGFSHPYGRRNARRLPRVPP